MSGKLLRERDKRYRVLALAGAILAHPDDWEANVIYLMDVIDRHAHLTAVWSGRDVLFTIKEMISQRLTKPIPWHATVTPDEATWLFGGD